MKYQKIFSFILIIFTINIYAEKPVLTMVFKSDATPPFIGAYPDNSGLFLELLTAAADKIGCDVKVIRGPKKRMYELLEEGKADIYVKANFHEDLSRYLFYFPNGMYINKRIYLGITSVNVPDLKTLIDINKNNLSWLIELGSSNEREAKEKNINHTLSELFTMDDAVKMIQYGRNIIMQVNKNDVDKYIKDNKIKSLNDIGIKVHDKIFAYENLNVKYYYMAFSRFSPYYKEIPNPKYNPNKPISVENFPVELISNSIPDKLRKVLKQMTDSGEVKKIMLKYNFNFNNESE